MHCWYDDNDCDVMIPSSSRLYWPLVCLIYHSMNVLNNLLRLVVVTGQIPIDRAGLRFAHCRYENNISSFIGHMHEVSLSYPY